MRRIVYRGEIKELPDVLTFKGREFSLVGVRSHQNQKGEMLLLAEWAGVCRDCGDKYVTARIPTKSAEPALSCEACRP
jgi:hypothetical protein